MGCGSISKPSAEAPEDGALHAACRSDDWNRLEGEALERALGVHVEWQHSPMRLVDARYIVRLAGYKQLERTWWALQGECGRMQRRQELPSDARAQRSST